jgi:hypothetical protein
MSLKRSNDRKTANLVVNGQSKIKNAFGLPAGLSCPGKTAFCYKICYALRTENFRSAVGLLVMHNFNLLLACNDRVQPMVDLLDEMVAGFRKDCERLNAPKFFRIHWDGDFFSDNYAKAWALVIEKNDDIDFWVYTRVESSARIIHKTRATLYFSGDPDNEDAVRRMAKAGIRIAYVDDTFEDGRDAMHRLNARAVKCPENNKKIPLISDDKSACMACGVCVHGRNNVLFSRNKNRARKALPEEAVA